MRTVFRLAPWLLMLLASAAVCAGDGTFDRQVAAEPRGVVDISNLSGTIDVKGWDRAEVSVHAELDSDLQRVEVSSEHGHTTIRVVPASHSHGGEVELRVQVPKDSEVTVSAVSADVKSQGILGVQRFNAVSGDVTAEIAGSDIEAKAVSGDVHLERAGGDIEAGTVNGSLIASLDGARSVRAHTTSGQLRFDGTLARGTTLEASSISGNLTVHAGADGGFAYEVSSFSGNISDCFNTSPERTSQYGPGSRLSGTRDEGAGHVRLKTMSGNVELCDRR